MPNQPVGPLLLEPTVRLERAPLIRVLCQLRWPQLSRPVDSKLVADGIGSQLGDDYPFRSDKQEFGLSIDPQGQITPEPAGSVYQFSSKDSNWAIALGDQFIALQTSQYEDFADFEKRLSKVVSVTRALTDIPLFSRIGYRYTNRLEQPSDIQNLGTYFQSSILGGVAAELNDDQDIKLNRVVTETLLDYRDSYLLVRSALLGPRESIEPTIEPVERRSWLIDIDSYVESSQGISGDDLFSRIRELSRKGSSYFRSLLTEEGLKRFE